MSQYSKVLEMIKVAFPEATHISLHLETSHKEIDKFLEAEEGYTAVQDHEVSDRRYVRLNRPLGTIILTNGS